VAALFVCAAREAGAPAYETVVSEEGGVRNVIVYYRKPWLRPWQPVRYLLAHLRGYRLIRRHWGAHADLVHLNVIWPAGLFAWFLNLRYRLPVLMTEHATLYHTGLTSWQKRLARTVGRRARLLCPVSDHLGEAMARTGISTPRETIPNVVDTELFAPSGKPHTGKKMVLHVSTLDERQKNISGILRTAARLAERREDFELHLVSELDPSHVVRLAREMHLEGRYVFVHRFMPLPEVAARMQRADLFLLFSRYENLPCVILEAMATGLPVLSSDVGGIREHLLPAYGRLVPSEDEPALLEALAEMLDHPERFDAGDMRTYAVDHFSQQAVGRKFHEAYTRLLRGRTAPDPA
jgi:glycosyltransferase involved in cell wall biosynthesis